MFDKTYFVWLQNAGDVITFDPKLPGGSPKLEMEVSATGNWGDGLIFDGRINAQDAANTVARTGTFDALCVIPFGTTAKVRIPSDTNELTAYARGNTPFGAAIRIREVL